MRHNSSAWMQTLEKGKAAHGDMTKRGVNVISDARRAQYLALRVRHRYGRGAYSGRGTAGWFTYLEYNTGVEQLHTSVWPPCSAVDAGRTLSQTTHTLLQDDREEMERK